MAGAPKVRSMNVADAEARPVLGPAGIKAKSPAKKLATKPLMRKTEEGEEAVAAKPWSISMAPSDSPPQSPPALSAPLALRRHAMLLHSNLSLNASCSSDASSDSFCSRGSTGRIDRSMSFSARRSRSLPKLEKASAKLKKGVSDDASLPQMERWQGKRRCSWVTSNTEPCYAAFHDEEWGVPVHEDRKLFELLVLSGALAELTWPTILAKRHIFRGIFLDFDPVLVSKLNEKKLVALSGDAISLLSEPKLRAVVENARQIVKIAEEFGSFDNYCWSFINFKPVTNSFRYPRQVPVRTSKADVISKDLVRRGFRSVGPTVIYTFMQAVGMTNDHLVGCFRFSECASAGSSPGSEDGCAAVGDQKAAEGDDMACIGLELSSAVEGLGVS